MIGSRAGLLLGVLVAACGGGTGDEVDAMIIDGHAGAGDGGGSDGNAGDSDGGGGADDRLYPATVGHTWTYQVSAVGAGAICAPGTQTEEVLSQESVGGRSAFAVDPFCSAVGTTYLAVDGDKVEAYYQNGWIVTLDVPVEEGHTWTSTGPVVYTWKREGTVTVPAGTFDDCWRREQQVTYTAYSIYCRGVGEVRSYSQDLGGNGWDAQLSATNF